MERMIKAQREHKAYLGVVSQAWLVYMVGLMHCFTKEEDWVPKKLGTPNCVLDLGKKIMGQKEKLLLPRVGFQFVGINLIWF
jgi:hypothetical protein